MGKACSLPPVYCSARRGSSTYGSRSRTSASNSPPNRPLRSPSDKVYLTQDVLATTEIYITSTLRGLPVVHRRWSTSTPSKSPTFVHCAALFNWYVIPFANRSNNDGILICDCVYTDIYDGTARVTRFSVTHTRPGAVEDNTEQAVSVSQLNAPQYNKTK